MYDLIRKLRVYECFLNFFIFDKNNNKCKYIQCLLRVNDCFQYIIGVNLYKFYINFR